MIIKSLAVTPGNAHIRQRLREESNFSFEHPGLPQVLDFYETPTELFLVVAAKEGISLTEFAQTVKQRDKPEFVLELLRQLEPLFNELKNRHIVHLDIKPGNIIVSGNTTDLKVALIDFGMAKRTDEQEQRSTLFPLGYAAPELVLNRLHLANHRSDIYSLGITLWQFFTGKIPLLHPNPSVTTNLQLTLPLPEHELVPAKYLEILRKMAAKHAFAKPADHYPAEKTDEFLKTGMDLRYTNLYDVIADWQTALAAKRKRWFGF